MENKARLRLLRIISLTHDLPSSFALAGYPVHLADSQSARFSLDSRLRWSVSEIFEVCRNTEVATTHELNDGLQFVFLFSCDANLLVLQLALDFEPLGFDGLDNFFGFVPFEALLDLQFLPGMTDG